MFRPFPLVALTVCLTLTPLSATAQDVASGPEEGTRLPALKVHDETGMNKGKEVNYAGDRKDKLTVYVLIAADKFDRPMNRFLKTLDGELGKNFEGAYAV